MNRLAVGQKVVVVKLHPDGHEAARYPGTVISVDAPDDWFVIEAWWTVGRIVAGGLVFEVGDRLLEWFSPSHWFNVFHVFDPEGRTRGWYANITYATRCEFGGDAPIVTWRDLYLDLIAPSGQPPTIYDAEELEESGLLERDPQLHAHILNAMAELQAMARLSTGPFAEQG